MGLTFQELQELLEYIKEHHSWEKMWEITEKNPKAKIIKYVQFTVDTRECDIWNFRFYDIIGEKEYEKLFRTEQGYNLKEEIYKWLQGK